MARKGSSSKSAPPATTRRMAVIIGGGLATLAALFLLTGQPESAANLHPRSMVEHPAAAPALFATGTRPAGNYSALLRRNLFQPLVVNQAHQKLASANGSLLPLTPNGLQALAAASPPTGWSYIGSATVDGVAFALLQKGDDYGYYRAGESLDGYVIRSVGSDSLVLAGPSDVPVRLPKTSGAPAVSSAAPAAAPAAPANAGNPAPAGTATAAASAPAAAPDNAANENSGGNADATNAFGGQRRQRRGGGRRGGQFGGFQGRQNGFQGRQSGGFQGNGMNYMNHPIYPSRSSGGDRANEKA